MKYTDDYILKSAIEKYGVSVQVVKAAEECSELAAILAKTHCVIATSDSVNFTKEYEFLMNGKITEEIADVLIMIQQLKLAGGHLFSLGVEKKYREKMERLAERLGLKNE